MTTNDLGLAPSACTLPTAERPLRLAEFDDLFTQSLRSQDRLAPTRLRWLLDPSSSAAARDLISRETECCSFFTFTLADTAAGLTVEIDVPAACISVLDALQAMAAHPAGTA